MKNHEQIFYNDAISKLARLKSDGCISFNDIKRDTILAHKKIIEKHERDLRAIENYKKIMRS